MTEREWAGERDEDGEIEEVRRTEREGKWGGRD